MLYMLIYLLLVEKCSTFVVQNYRGLGRAPPLARVPPRARTHRAKAITLWRGGL